MKDMINIIISNNKELLGDNSNVSKIDIGFTNTLYSIDNRYIIKICTNHDNEKYFLREIDYYNKNKDNSLIPKLYYANTSKKDIPYYYEILEKVEGKPLYSVWHTLSDSKREDIIKQLCISLKQIHSNKGNSYNWCDYIKDKFNKLYLVAKDKNIFNNDELYLIEYALSKFDRYLDSEDFVLVHNDIHFDNIIYNDGMIKLIDFERSMYAPCDFELDILYRMVRNPWKFASSDEEEFIEFSDYTNIMTYMNKYYPELFKNKYLEQRLAIYDMVYYLRQLLEYPDIKELKDNIIMGAKVVAFKDELFYDNLKSPQELMDYMDVNIKYGWLDFNGNRHINNLKGFRENYRISSIDKMIETGLGICIEQAKMIKDFFDRMNIENRLYCYRSYETEENFDKDVKMHCFVLFKYDDHWYHFEHSNSKNKGIHKYNTPLDAIQVEIDRHDENDIRELSLIPDIPSNISFKDFNNYVNKYDSIYIKKKTL